MHRVGSGPWGEYERLSQLDATTLTLRERRLVAFGEMRTELNNGGFDQYFFNSSGDRVLDAMAAVIETDAQRLAELLQRALDLLGASDPSDRAARQERLEAMDGDSFETLDAEYLSLEASLDLDQLMRRLGT